MSDTILDFFFEYGVFFIMAVASVMIKTLYTDEEQNFKTVIRSLVSALVITFLFVENTKTLSERPVIFAYVFVASILSDSIVKTIMKLSQRILKDPKSIMIFIKRNKDMLVKILDVIFSKDKDDKKGKK